MRYSLSWLKEFIETSLPATALADRLTLAGCEITSFEWVDEDWIMQAQVTPNRPDLLSHVGLAREVAAVLGREFRPPRWLKRQTRPFIGHGNAVGVTIEDAEGCRRYVGLAIDNVTVAPSTPDIARRLKSLGIRPVNNVVDITNLCMMELGQPLHAFDLDKLEGGMIRVRRARPREMIVTIDGVSRELGSEQLVIADAKKPVALAGIMGGRETEVTPATRNVFLESAWFDPKRIRAEVRASKLASDSSYRFERGVDLAMVQTAAVRAARMICLYGGGRIARGMSSTGNLQLHRRKITLRPKHAQEVLGMRIYPAQQKKLLQRLSCKVSGTAQNWKVEPPSWRNDLRIQEDLYEELARLVGYDRCPATLPPTFRQPAAKWKPTQEPAVERQRLIKQLLCETGAQEIMTYSLLHPDDEPKTTLSGKSFPMNPLVLAEPLSIDQTVLRRTLLAGALKAAAWNFHHKSAESLQFFEIGRVFLEDVSTSPPTTLNPYLLGILLVGTPAPTWGVPAKPFDLFDLKGTLAFLFERLRVGPIETEIGRTFFGEAGIRYLSQNKEIGFAGAVDPKVLAAFDLPANTPVFYAELQIDEIIRMEPAPLVIQPMPKVAAVSRDLAVLVSDRSSYGQICAAIEKAGQPLLQSVRLFDLYKGRQVPAGKISLAFRLNFSDRDRTLTDEEVSAVHAKIVDSLKMSFSATLRT